MLLLQMERAQLTLCQAWQEGSTTGLIPAQPSQSLLVLDLKGSLSSCLVRPWGSLGLWSRLQPQRLLASPLACACPCPLCCHPSPPWAPAQLCPARGSHRHSCVDLPLPHHSPSLSIPSFLSPQVWRTLGPFCEVNVVFALFCALPSPHLPCPALALLQPLPEGFPWRGEGRLERKAPSHGDRWAALHAGTLGSPQLPFPLHQCSRVLAVSTLPRG